MRFRRSPRRPAPPRGLRAVASVEVRTLLLGLLPVLALLGPGAVAAQDSSELPPASAEAGAAATETLVRLDDLLSKGKTKKALKLLDPNAEIRLVQCDGAEQKLGVAAYQAIFDGLHQAMEAYVRERRDVTTFVGRTPGEVVVVSTVVEHFSGPGYSGEGISFETSRVVVGEGEGRIVGISTRARCGDDASGD